MRRRGLTVIELLIVLAMVGVVAAIAYPSYQHIRERVRIGEAIADISNIEQAINRFQLANERLPNNLQEVGMAGLEDPWDNPYQYLNISTVKGKGKLRKDKNLVPLNTDYDLYSMGKDGASRSPLTAKASRDDIVRANNGGFVGLASDY